MNLKQKLEWEVRTTRHKQTRKMMIRLSEDELSYLHDLSHETGNSMNMIIRVMINERKYSEEE